MNKEKSILLESLRAVVKKTQEKITFEKERVRKIGSKSLAEVKNLSPQDQVVFFELRGYTEQSLEELEHLYGSPFFVKCELLYEKDRSKKILYFAKHSLSSEQIYSWVAPIAAVRFEKPGQVSYQLPSGRIEQAIMTSKEQYMIVDGKVIFFAAETTDSPRELIYQTHFSSRKSGFVLPEIVAVMEKAQDAVIRAHHVGPFVISGPAGSGKTTLALHRVAYLVQSPDTSPSYPKESVIVFVQDDGTKDYFSHLLPELGINNVKITTFFEWAAKILSLSDVTFIAQFGDSEHGGDVYELEKLKALRSPSDIPWNPDVFSVLKKYYELYFSEESQELFSQQKKGKILDRIDVTIVLSLYLKTHGKFETQRKYQVVAKNGGLRSKTAKTPVIYSLMVIDEFQNYMPEQLLLLKKCINQDTKSVVYVGDMAQQVQLGTIRSWDEVGESVDGDRSVKLHKVYRNTKQILEYIKELGYEVNIPSELREGPNVIEKNITSSSDVFEYIEKLIFSNKGKTIGVISKDSKDIVELKIRFVKNEQVHVCTMIESQGVEFDIICIIGIRSDFLKVRISGSVSDDIISEKERIYKDLLYVALTRAIEEMHILGSCNLKKVFDAKRP